MKKRKNNRKLTLAKAVLMIACMFLVALLAASLSALLLHCFSFSDELAGAAGELTSGLIAAIAAGLVILELRSGEKERIHQNEIEEASFLLQYNQTFIQDSNMTEVESLLEAQAFYGKQEPIITEENRQKFINYLVYLEGLAPLILRGILKLEHIDDLMAYRFFLAVNNREVQEKELKRFAGDYRGCYKLYKIWAKYRKEKGYTIHLNETALDRWEEFENYAS